MIARSTGLEELVSAQHPGTSMAPSMAASTNPRLRGLDNMNPPTVRSASLRLATPGCLRQLQVANRARLNPLSLPASIGFSYEKLRGGIIQPKL
jgi:hypothetical protein